jgi:chromate reductase
VEIFDIGGLPLFNEDNELPLPGPVAALKSGIAAADAVLIATPEYNQSMPGTLKNALDWAARPNKGHVLTGKPVGIMGASSGKSGTMRSQLFLRGVLHALGCRVLPRPEIFLPFARSRFDEDGGVTDPEVVREVHALVQALRDWGQVIQGQAAGQPSAETLSDAGARRA